ncbi:GNAT family N-acetyltransferase [Parashewanella tropica]|uniref:GNAT family N-acetyltransferase n=1 Tax=Parashewanella tropica TaxID=2547970 RepID=UPI001059899F|nr:GNAT family N-acetyltransferase [Parashewanella tropica]
MNYELSETNPAPEEYNNLRIAAGLSPKSITAATIGLPNSLYSVCIRSVNQELIGMGRVIGDGACFFQIVDIAVHPKFQGNGLGRMIMGKLESYLQSVALEGSYVSLIGDKPEFYTKLGYQHTAPAGHGMYKKLA